jgi:hypothetical protein
MFALPELFGSPYVLPAIIAVVILLLLLLLLSMRSRRRGGSPKKARKTATGKATAKRSYGASSPATAGAGSGTISATGSTSTRSLQQGAGVTPSSSGDPVAAVVSSIVQGWGDLTNEDTNRLKIFRPEKVIAAIAATELPKDLKSAEHARARLNQLRHYASSLEQSLPAAGTPQPGAEGEGQPETAAELQTEPGPGQPPEPQADAPAETQTEPQADLEPEAVPAAQESAASSEPAGEGTTTSDATWAEASEQTPDPDRTAETGLDAGDLWDVDENTTAWGAGTAAAAAVGAGALEEAEAYGEEERAEADALADDQLDVVEETAVEEVPLLDEVVFADEAVFADEVAFAEEAPFAEETVGGGEATGAAAATEAAEGTSAAATDEAMKLGGEAGGDDFFSSLQGKVSTADDLLALPAEEQAGMLAFLQPAELGKVFRATSDVALKKSVIDTLGDIGNTDSLDVLRECLDDSDPQIQIYALDAADRLLGAD